MGTRSRENGCLCVSGVGGRERDTHTYTDTQDASGVPGKTDRLASAGFCYEASLCYTTSLCYMLNCVSSKDMYVEALNPRPAPGFRIRPYLETRLLQM